MVNPRTKQAQANFQARSCLLLERSSAIGVFDTEILSFTNYLSHRVQRIKVCNRVFSSWSSVKGGVLQGNALVPLFMSMLCHPSLSSYGRLLQFADDTTLICSGDSHDEVQYQLECNLEYCCFHG